MKQKLKKTFIYKIYLKIKYFIFPLLLLIYKIDRREIKEKESLSNKDDIIVSLTSFPARINMVYNTILSIFNQTQKPDKIVLWLSEKQFPKREGDLPPELEKLKKYGLEINWLNEDIKSYKKLLPALEKYPNSIIITADDDLYYPKYWIKRLVDSYNLYPQDIHCHLVTRLKIVGNEITRGNKINTNDASYLNKILGGSGTLYPPGCFDKEIFNFEKIRKLAPTSDDIWFWAMAVRNKRKIRLIKNGMKKLINVEFSQETTDCLCNINDGENGFFKKHLNNVAKEYKLIEIIKSNSEI